MATKFIFVHGGFGSPAELAPTVPHLEAMGHRVVNVDLPSEQADTSLDDYAGAVVQAMVDISGPRILVAHSAGGAQRFRLLPSASRWTASFTWQLSCRGRGNAFSKS